MHLLQVEEQIALLLRFRSEEGRGGGPPPRVLDTLGVTLTSSIMQPKTFAFCTLSLSTRVRLRCRQYLGSRSRGTHLSQMESAMVTDPASPTMDSSYVEQQYPSSSSLSRPLRMTAVRNPHRHLLPAAELSQPLAHSGDRPEDRASAPGAYAPQPGHHHRQAQHLLLTCRRGHRPSQGRRR